MFSPDTTAELDMKMLIGLGRLMPLDLLWGDCAAQWAIGKSTSTSRCRIFRAKSCGAHYRCKRQGRPRAGEGITYGPHNQLPC
jgi:hypothetical protein